ncbi:glycoside hydrolase family 32 protein [Elizabethkingia meningoseptica]|uniref:glycoside hydrolase family 32 protein n=1 Tax=Elizabethkingia meningoseptica TaxID=238 RepID=UPI0022F17BD5|nr:glycoside hydrolase family 32 protein [Elizabethkingia meningoseptica]EJK5328180.1 glycoside hydrolase family 32 protein [Elizabethkingia meningoseptica]WBS74057.1 glycoside hydrolase family 32 protein [Elizabethkingia meningoseptica]
MRKIIPLMIIASAFSSGLDAQHVAKLSEEQLYRPNYHFTPKKGWMNDPNGLYYLDGIYHLFYQHFPDGNKWGPMHWGHATSKDLIKWAEQPIALFPDELGYIFSGSAVVDKDNTSGFGDGKNVPVVAIFTYHDPKKEKENKIDVETQGIAYSLDNGKTWTKYTSNPVLKNPGIKDFRDPKVLWDKTNKQWTMVLAAQDEAHFYTSKNLKDWTFQSAFGKELGAHGGVWECPDLFPIKVENSDETKWVLIQNMNPGGPNGGSGVQYFVGDFDGKTFKMDVLFTKQLEKEKAVWLDWGKDNYASVSFDNVHENKRVIIGWMTNWEYAQDVPTEAWRSSATIAREVGLKKTEDGYVLTNVPVAQLKKYEGRSISKSLIIGSEKTLITKNEIDLSKAVVDLDLKKMITGLYTFTLKNKLGESVTVGFDNKNKSLFIDRSKSGNTNFGNNFATEITKAPLSKSFSEAKLKLLIDKTSVEIFLNNGEKVMTQTFFPNQTFSELSISSDTKGSSLNVKAYQLNIK